MGYFATSLCFEPLSLADGVMFTVKYLLYSLAYVALNVMYNVRCVVVKRTDNL